MPAPYTPFPQQVLVTPQAPGNTSAPDGAGIPLLGGKQGDAIVSQLHGDFFTQTYRGNVFHGDVGQAGVLLTTYNATTVTGLCIWNPASSGKLVVPIFFRIGWHDTTGAPGAMFYEYVTGVGDNVATAAPISAFTAVTPANGYIGGGLAPKAKFGSGCTIASAGTILGSAGISQLTTTGTAATVGMFQIIDEFKGTVIIPPGTLFFVAGSQALLSKFNLSMVWEEVPL